MTRQPNPEITNERPKLVRLVRNVDKTMTATKHVPFRTCVVCGDKMPKRELVRVVVTPRGGVLLDASGKMQGRGAYVCGGDCIDGGVKRGRLEFALRVKLSDLQWADLVTSFDSLVVSSVDRQN